MAKKYNTIPQAKLTALGINAICDMIKNGESVDFIAKSIGVSYGTLWDYLHLPENIDQSARAREASAEAWLDKGLDAIKSSLSKSGDIDATAARAYAFECARRAALRNPTYRDQTRAPDAPTVSINIATNTQSVAMRLMEGGPPALPNNTDDGNGFAGDFKGKKNV